MLSKWAKFHSTNRSNVYNSQARRQDFAARGCKNHNGGALFSNTILNACSNRHNSRLQHVNFIHIYLDPQSYTDMNAEPTERRHLLFCNLDKERHKK